MELTRRELLGCVCAGTAVLTGAAVAASPAQAGDDANKTWVDVATDGCA